MDYEWGYTVNTKITWSEWKYLCYHPYDVDPWENRGLIWKNGEYKIDDDYLFIDADDEEEDDYDKLFEVSLKACGPHPYSSRTRERHKYPNIDPEEYYEITPLFNGKSYSLPYLCKNYQLKKEMS